ncbi:hypothetical protein ACRXCV_05020 [Halobacteriovorax sp. GFR7]|uniref:hypothetical protein n=1 Tax=unclassified Halobacteriovorax TaxID=2639665 RepID=UPI003D95903A
MNLIDELKKKKKFKEKKESSERSNVVYTKSGARLNASSDEIFRSLKRDLSIMKESKTN